MLKLEEAQERLLDCVRPLQTERVPVQEAVGRIVREEILAPIPLPRFDNSAVDGYAVRNDELRPAARERPVKLRLAGEAGAGKAIAISLPPGACFRVFTGTVLPDGCNAVVMQEDVETGAGGETVRFFEPVRPFENVRVAGEDVAQGTPLCRAGDRLTVGKVSLLAAAGIPEIPVGRRPVIGILATGDELREPGQELTPGQIYESNRIALAALVQQAGGVGKVFPLVSDRLDETEQALRTAFASCDAVVTSGGVSVGAYDFVKNAFERLGGKLDFWRVAVRPGKPFVFGTWGDKFLFGVPGNPVSAVVTFLLLVRPALVQMQGGSDQDLPSAVGTLSEPLANSGDRLHFVRVRQEANGTVTSAGGQASHALGSLAHANGLVALPPGSSLAPGATVTVLRID